MPAATPADGARPTNGDRPLHVVPDPPGAAAAAATAAATAEVEQAPEEVATAVETVHAGAFDIDGIKAIWPAVLDLLRPSQGLVVSILEKARPCQLDGDDLTIGFFENVAFRKKVEDPAIKKAVAEAVAQLSGHAVTVRYELREEEAEAAPQTISEDELLAKVKSTFDAEEIVPDDPVRNE